MKEFTQIESRLSPAMLTGYKMNDKTTFETLKKFGISFDEMSFETMKAMYKVKLLKV